jgi:hypothetical protein
LRLCDKLSRLRVVLENIGAVSCLAEPAPQVLDALALGWIDNVIGHVGPRLKGKGEKRGAIDCRSKIIALRSRKGAIALKDCKKRVTHAGPRRRKTGALNCGSRAAIERRGIV